MRLMSQKGNHRATINQKKRNSIWYIEGISVSFHTKSSTVFGFLENVLLVTLLHTQNCTLAIIDI